MSEKEKKKIACEDMPVIKVKAAILKGLYCFLGVARKERKWQITKISDKSGVSILRRHLIN